MTVRNARITSTMLGIEDHGIMTFFITVEWSGGGVGIGGYNLDANATNDHGIRQGGAAYQAIRCILETVGVDSWEKLKGQLVRIDEDGAGTRVSKIGNIIKDQWFDLAEYMKKVSQ